MKSKNNEQRGFKPWRNRDYSISINVLTFKTWRCSGSGEHTVISLKVAAGVTCNVIYRLFQLQHVAGITFRPKLVELNTGAPPFTTPCRHWGFLQIDCLWQPFLEQVCRCQSPHSICSPPVSVHTYVILAHAWAAAESPDHLTPHSHCGLGVL